MCPSRGKHLSSLEFSPYPTSYLFIYVAVKLRDNHIMPFELALEPLKTGSKTSHRELTHAQVLIGHSFFLINSSTKKVLVLWFPVASIINTIV